jgi:CO/xanthine dehydrogenase Mo-binding subunit
VIGQQIQGTSNTFEQYMFNTSNVTSLDWVGYPITRFKDHPNVTPIVIQSLDRPTNGAGEETLANVAPAIANAFFDATGVRLRQLPLTPAKVRYALAQAKVS